MDVNKRYLSDQLLPIFKNRLPSKNRADYRKMVEWLHLSGTEDEYGLLSKFGLIPGTDSLLVYPEPEIASGIYKLEFFVHGMRHMHPHAAGLCDELKAGDRLLPLLDVQNPVDQNAVAVRCAEPAVLIGYVPTFYAADIRRLLSDSMLAADARLTVCRLNADAPFQLRLLCQFECPCPRDFKALDTDAHRPVRADLVAELPR